MPNELAGTERGRGSPGEKNQRLTLRSRSLTWWRSRVSSFSDRRGFSWDSGCETSYQHLMLEPYYGHVVTAHPRACSTRSTTFSGLTQIRPNSEHHHHSPAPLVHTFPLAETSACSSCRPKQSAGKRPSHRMRYMHACTPDSWPSAVHYTRPACIHLHSVPHTLTSHKD